MSNHFMYCIKKKRLIQLNIRKALKPLQQRQSGKQLMHLESDTHSVTAETDISI